jgi:asparagine synthase (glutamine-hydrolysing)
MSGTPIAQQNGVDGIGGQLSFDAGVAFDTTTSDLRVTDDRLVRATADARLTNAATLRAELQQLGRAFTTDTDSELIAHAYVVWGPSCVMRFRGPFACAIWDESERRLVLARDRVGFRPLYFSLLPDQGVLFASGIRTLLVDQRVDRRWCPQAVDAYLALGYVPSPLTPFQRITKIEPAQMVIVEGRRLRAEQYWDFPVTARHPGDDLESAATLDRALRTVLGRMTGGSDTRLLYSGGPASSALMAAWPRDGRAPLTVAVEDDATELTRSHHAAAHLGRERDLDTFRTPVPVAAAQFAAIFDEPIADPSAVTQFAVCDAARRHTGRAVAGHGASVLWLGGEQRKSVWDGFRRRDIYTREFAWQVRDTDPLARHLELYASRHDASPLERALYVDARTFLPDSTLAAAHRARTAAGLELDFPFLEHDLVQLAFAVAGAHRSWGRRPSVLQHLLQRTLPRPLLPPFTQQAPQPWLRDAVAAMVPSMLLTPRFDGRGIVSRPALRDLWNEHRDGRRDHAHRLWALVMLEGWFRAFVDSEAAGEPLEYAVRRHGASARQVA